MKDALGFYRTMGKRYRRKFDKIIRYSESFDILKRDLDFNGIRNVMYYIDGFVKAESMQKLMMHLTSVKDFGDGKVGGAEYFSKLLPAVEVDVVEKC